MSWKNIICFDQHVQKLHVLLPGFIALQCNASSTLLGLDFLTSRALSEQARQKHNWRLCACFLSWIWLDRHWVIHCKYRECFSASQGTKRREIYWSSDNYYPKACSDFHVPWVDDENNCSNSVNPIVVSNQFKGWTLLHVSRIWNSIDRGYLALSPHNVISG